jgi:hypothetical protein
MKALLVTAVLALASPAIAGEDSTDHYGPGGTGPAWYQTGCGLKDFRGGEPVPAACRRPRSNEVKQPLTQAGPTAARQASGATQEGANQ